MATMATFVHSTWPHVKNRFYTEIQYHPLRPPPPPVVEHPRLGPKGASALRAQFESNLTAIWFKFDVGGQETEAPQGPRLQ